MKKIIAMLLSVLMLGSLLAGCGEKPAQDEPSTDEGKKEITMWFWGTSDYQRTAMEKYLVEGFNASQD